MHVASATQHATVAATAPAVATTITSISSVLTVRQREGDRREREREGGSWCQQSDEVFVLRFVSFGLVSLCSNNNNNSNCIITGLQAAPIHAHTIAHTHTHTQSHAHTLHCTQKAEVAKNTKQLKTNKRSWQQQQAQL